VPAALSRRQQHSLLGERTPAHKPQPKAQSRTLTTSNQQPVTQHYQQLITIHYYHHFAFISLLFPLLCSFFHSTNKLPSFLLSHQEQWSTDFGAPPPCHVSLPPFFVPFSNFSNCGTSTYQMGIID